MYFKSLNVRNILKKENPKYDKIDKSKFQSLIKLQENQFSSDNGRTEVLSFLKENINITLTNELSNITGDKKTIPKNQYYYEWSQLSSYCLTFLEGTSNMDDLNTLMEVLKDFEGKLKLAKENFKLNDEEEKILAGLNLKPQFEINNLSPIHPIKNQPIDEQKQILFDVEYLKQRILYCLNIKNNVNEKLKKLVDVSAKDAYKEQLFADIKGSERSEQKICENIAELKDNEKKSVIQDLKDLCRASFICETAEKTKLVFKALTKGNGDFQVQSVKNMFVTVKDKSNQRDIKVILVYKSDKFHELVEVQIIQEIQLKFKKVEHKIQDFTRSEGKFKFQVSENKEEIDLLKSLIEGNLNSGSIKQTTLWRFKEVKDLFHEQDKKQAAKLKNMTKELDKSERENIRLKEEENERLNAKCATSFPSKCEGSKKKCDKCKIYQCTQHHKINHMWIGGGHDCNDD